MAINKSAIIEAVFNGSGIQAKNLLPPRVWSADDKLEDYAYDPEKMKALLKETGYNPYTPIERWAMPVQRPYNPNTRRMAEITLCRLEEGRGERQNGHL